MLDKDSVLKLRMQRNYLISPAAEDEYNRLFRIMSPVSTEYWCRPGSPPTLPPRADFNDYGHCFRLRANREIIKGRFQNGGIAYIFADELELFGAVYKKDSKKLSGAEAEILDLIRTDGPLTIKSIKEITGLNVKKITPILHNLQSKFLVFEDQADDEWDRAWYFFENEFPDVDFNKYTRIEAIKTIILRFAYLYVHFDEDNIRSYYCFSLKDIKTAISELVAENKLLPAENGYILPEDEEALNSQTEPCSGVIALQRNDFLVKANAHILYDRYKHTDYDIKYFLLIDGEFRGAVYGFFKFTAVPLEDVFVGLPENEAEERKDEIISAIGRMADLSVTPLKRYRGNAL
jgi:hypothetical protein